MFSKRKPRDQEPPAEPDVPEPEPITGPALIKDELGLFQPWYFQMRLDEELARAARGGTIFSIGVWEPRLLPTDQPNPEMLTRAAGLILSRLRTYDIASQLSERRYVALLLDADYRYASTVVFRLQADIQTENKGIAKWRAGIATYGRDGVDAESLLGAAARRLEPGSAAAAA